jgi:hypothetical protein
MSCLIVCGRLLFRMYMMVVNVWRADNYATAVVRAGIGV